MRLSLVIPAKSLADPKLAELLASIEKQSFPKDWMETLVITDGTSESAKAIGIRRAKGEVIGILASDNELMDSMTLRFAYEDARVFGASSPSYYHYQGNDDVLNRYFSLIGGNDPLAFYMKKNDRSSYLKYEPNPRGSIGDNGFFIRRECIVSTNLDNYYHVDNAIESNCNIRWNPFAIWHKTGGNIFKFFTKRYRYGLQHAFNKNRRWHLVDFRQPKDTLRLLWFVVASVSLVHPLWTSIRGYRKLRDLAWFMHPIACLFTVCTYGALVIHVTLRHLFQSLFVLMAGRTA